VIGAITPEGRMFMQMQDHACTAEDVVRFLRLLLPKIPGKLLVIWDGAAIHRAKVSKRISGSRGGQAASSGASARLCC
jgi:transposase